MKMQQHKCAATIAEHVQNTGIFSTQLSQISATRKFEFFVNEVKRFCSHK